MPTTKPVLTVTPPQAWYGTPPENELDGGPCTWVKAVDYPELDSTGITQLPHPMWGHGVRHDCLPEEPYGSEWVVMQDMYHVVEYAVLCGMYPRNSHAHVFHGDPVPRVWIRCAHCASTLSHCDDPAAAHDLLSGERLACSCEKEV